MNDLFFDTGALQLYLLGDSRFEQYMNQISNEKVKAFTSMLNMVELYYKTLEKLGAQTAESWYWRIINSDFTVIKDISESVGIQAAKLKMKYKKTVPLVDAMILAFTLEMKCTLLTTDSGLKNTKETCTILHFPLKS